MRVQTVGYYHRDSEFNVTPDLLPRTLNPNRRFFDNPYRNPLPPIDLNINIPDSGAGELKMESLLEYINLKCFPNHTPPQFVTNRQLLSTIAAGADTDLRIVVLRFSGVIFMWKLSTNPTWHTNFGAVFENFWTEGVDTDGIVRKGVFLAEIPSKRTSDAPFSVLYSGEIDAIDDSGDHFEFKVFFNGMNDYFWNAHSCRVYWQAILGNVKTLVIGARTGKFPIDPKTRPPSSRCLPENSVYKVEKLSPLHVPQKLNCFCQLDPSVKKWSISEGQTRLTQFLDFVKTISDDEALLITRDKESGWEIEKDPDVTKEFEEAVRSRLMRYQ